MTPCIAMHVRQGDAQNDARGEMSVDRSLKRHVDCAHHLGIHQGANNIFLATDNKETQDKFIKLYGDRLICNPIINNNNLRQTSIQDAVVDMYVCSYAKEFEGTIGSSFSDTINYLRKNNQYIYKLMG
jgi:hypothetical protein